MQDQRRRHFRGRRQQVVGERTAQEGAVRRVGILLVKRSPKAMTEQSAIDTAVKRLALALDALDAAVERRKHADRNEEGLAAQVQALGVDRTRLAAALDGETARSRRLETTNREIAERLDSAIATIQSVLDVHE